MNFKNTFVNSSNIHQAFWVGMGSFSSFALGIVSAAILSRYFEKTEYGTYRQIIYVYNSFLVVFTAGLPRVFAYYLPRYTLAQGKNIVWKISKILFVAGLAFSVFLFTSSGLLANILRNPELETGLKYFSPIPMLLLPTLGIEGIFSTYKKAVYIAIYNTLSRLLMLFFIIMPVIFIQASYHYAILGWIIASFITLIIAGVFINIPFNKVTTEKSDLGIKEMLRYSIPIAVASIAGIAIKAADQFYISRYFGAEVFAEFSNGFVELPFVHMVTGSVSIVLMPIFSKMIFDQASKDEVRVLWQSSLLKSATLIYPLVIFFMLFSRDIMIILYSAKYASASVYFILAMTVNLFNIVVFAPLILALGETAFYARLHAWMALASWILGFIVVLLFHNPVAIAIFSAARSIILVVIAIIFISSRLNIKLLLLFPGKKIVMIGLHALSATFIVKYLISRLLLPDLNSLTIVILSLIIYLCIILLTAKVFNVDYLDVVKSLLRKGINNYQLL